MTVGFMWQSDHRLRPHRMVWVGNENYDSRVLWVRLRRPLHPIPRMEFKPEPYLRTEIAALRHELHLDFVRLEAKIDSKPSIAALYQAVVVLMFWIDTVITATVVVLKNTGLMG
jgi:hypothetical protein